jgi:hypothetical protein
MASQQWTCFDPDRPAEWTEFAFADFVAAHRWVFARTMPRNRHEYTLRRETDDATFEAAVRFVRQHGVMETYGGKPYRVLYFGCHKYWTMGAPLEITILINRKRGPGCAEAPGAPHSGTIPRRTG